jgi:hypothetical protein
MIKKTGFWLAMLLLEGCATIFTGTTDTLRFDSNVPGVRLSIDGQYRGELPLTFDMSRNFIGGRQFMAKFEKPGYATQQFQLSREFNTVAILDISSTLVSGGIDVLTGALMRFSPTEYHVQMLEAGLDPRAAMRSADMVRFALVNFRRLQNDIARGGGEYLETYAAMAGDEATARLLERRRMLVTSTRAPAFVEQLLRATPSASHATP